MVNRPLEEPRPFGPFVPLDGDNIQVRAVIDPGISKIPFESFKDETVRYIVRNSDYGDDGEKITVEKGGSDKEVVVEFESTPSVEAISQVVTAIERGMNNVDVMGRVTETVVVSE